MRPPRAPPREVLFYYYFYYYADPREALFEALLES